MQTKQITAELRQELISDLCDADKRTTNKFIQVGSKLFTIEQLEAGTK